MGGCLVSGAERGSGMGSGEEQQLPLSPHQALPARQRRPGRASFKGCGASTVGCAVHSRTAPEAAAHPWPRLPLLFLKLEDLRRGPVVVCTEWRAVVSTATARLKAPQVDLLLRCCLLEVLHSRRQDGAFPAPASAIYSAMRREGRRLAERPGGIDELVAEVGGPEDAGHLVDWRPNVRDSTHRNLARTLKALQKEGLFIAKETRGDLVLTGLERTSRIAD